MRQTAAWTLVLALGVALGWALAPRAPTTAPAQRTMPLAEVAPSQAQMARMSEPRQELARLLEAFAFAEAAQYLQTTRRRLDRAEGAELRALFTAQALALQQRGETLRAVALLKAYLSVEHDDIDALALLAQCRVQLGDHAGALEALYAARGFAAQVEQQALFTQRIRALVPQYRARLESRADHEALAAMFADLITLEPDYAPYRIGLAQAQLALGDVAAAEATLQSAGQTSALDAQLASLRAQLDGGSGGESVGASVALQPAGEHFLVEAVLNGRRKLTLLLDTGASLTLISAAALRDAGLWPQYDSERMRLQTANGPIDVALLQVETLSLGTQTVADLQVGAWELDTPHGFDGLLGVDFLNRFDYVVDRRSAQLRFMAKTP